MPGFFICESRAASKFLIGIALLDTRFLKNENGENFVGAAGAFVTNDELATLRLDPEGIRVSPHGTFYISDEYGPYQVHCFHVVCESGRDLGAIYERYICRH